MVLNSVSTNVISLRVPDWYTMPRTWKVTVSSNGTVGMSDQTEMNRYLDRTMLDPTLQGTHASVLCPPICNPCLPAWLDLTERVEPRDRSAAVDFSNGLAPGFGMPLLHNGLTRTLHLPTPLFFSVYEFTLVAIIVRVENTPVVVEGNSARRGAVALFGKYAEPDTKGWPMQQRQQQRTGPFFLSGTDMKTQKKVLLNGIHDVIPGDVFVDEESHLSYMFDGEVWCSTRVATNEARVSGWFYFPKGMPDVGGKAASMKLRISSADFGTGGGWRWFQDVMIHEVFKAARFCISVDIKAMLKSERNLGPAGPLDYTRALWRHKTTSAPSADGSTKLKGIKDCFFCNAPFALFRTGKPFHARWRAPESSVLFNSLVGVYRTYKVATGQALEVDIGVLRSNLNIATTGTQHAAFVAKKARHAALGIARETTDASFRIGMTRMAIATGLMQLRKRMHERIAASTVKPADHRYVSGPQRKRLLEYGSMDHKRPAGKRPASDAVSEKDVFIVQLPEHSWTKFWSEMVTNKH